MRLIYLASPFSHPQLSVRKHRRLAAAGILAYYSNTESDISLYSSIVHWGYVEEYYSVPIHFDYWKHHDFFMISKSNALWVLPIAGWKHSHGVQQEIEYATDLNKPVQYIQMKEIRSKPHLFITEDSNNLEEYHALTLAGYARLALSRATKESPPLPEPV